MSWQKLGPTQDLESSTKCSIDNFTFIKVLGKGAWEGEGPMAPRVGSLVSPGAQNLGTPPSQSLCLLPGWVGPCTLGFALGSSCQHPSYIHQVLLAELKGKRNSSP